MKRKQEEADALAKQQAIQAQQNQDDLRAMEARLKREYAQKKREERQRR